MRLGISIKFIVFSIKTKAPNQRDSGQEPNRQNLFSKKSPKTNRFRGFSHAGGGLVFAARANVGVSHPSFIRTIPSASEFHRIVRTAALAGFTADRELVVYDRTLPRRFIQLSF